MLSLSPREIGLAVALAVMGFAFSTREWLLFLDGLNPFQGLIAYYVILYCCLLFLSRLDLVVFGFKIKDPLQTLGLMLVTFAFFITVAWSSPLVQIVTGRTADAVSPILFQSEDGAMWFLWQSAFPTAGVEVLRVLTYVVSPLLLAFVGGFLISRRVSFLG